MVKKVAIDLSWIKIDESGGVENHTINLLKYIYKKNLVFLVTPKMLKNKKYLWLKNCQIKVLTNYYFFNILYICFFSFFYFKKESIEKFFSTNIYCPIIKPKNMEITITLHHAMWLIFPKYYSSFKRIFFNLYYAFLGKNISFIAISNHIKNKFKNKFGYFNIDVIYNPILLNKNPKFKKKLIFENKKFFFYLAANEEHKNINTIIKAFQSKKVKDKFNLVIAGYKQQKRLMSKNIFLLGKVNEKLKSNLFSKCFCYIHPSIYEGFGMPLVEALKYKKKIITTRGGAIPEITLNKAVYINNPTNFNNWVNVITNFNSIKFPKIALKEINNIFNYKKTLKAYRAIIFNAKK